jgi:hypothetical protein
MSCGNWGTWRGTEEGTWGEILCEGLEDCGRGTESKG